MKIFFAAVVISLPMLVWAEADKIVFTTDVQTVKPNVLSGPITIQTQDVSGGVYQTPETLDIQFVSTSPNGEFLGSTGSPAVNYMSKNTANRTFYYRDSQEGTFILTINVRGRESGVELTASQQITISSEASQGNSSAEILGASSENVPETKSSGGSVAKASSLNSQLEILAGSDRATSPGSPIWFQATIKKNTTEAGLELEWSFGDGYVAVGPLVSHTYKYPGEYVVVLSARTGDIFSVSRLKVKVSEANLEVKDGGDYLEIVNNGSSEINLFNWKIENNGRGFVFQPNTIILPYSSLKLDKSLLLMKGLDNSKGLSLKNCMKEEVFAVKAEKENNATELSASLDLIQKETYLIREKARNLSAAAASNPIGSWESDISSSTNDLIYEAPRRGGLLNRTWLFITGLFD